jgi:hypothetical protein
MEMVVIQVRSSRKQFQPEGLTFLTQWRLFIIHNANIIKVNQIQLYALALAIHGNQFYVIN